jgi:hypothetical protein
MTTTPNLPNEGDSIPIFDRHGGFTAMTKLGTLWRPAHVLEKVAPNATTMIVQNVERGRFFQTVKPVAWVRCKIKGYGYDVMAYFNETTGERIA